MPKGALDKLKVANAVAGTAKSHAKGYVSKAGSFVGAGGAVAGAVSGGTLESEMRKAAIVADYIPMVGGTLSRGLRIGAKYAPKVASTAEVMAGQALQRPRVRLPDSSCDDRGISQTSPV
jgi:hypothetical protein